MHEIERRGPGENTQENSFDQGHNGEEKISLVCSCITKQCPGPDQICIDVQRSKQSNYARTPRICVYEVVPREKLDMRFSAPIRPVRGHAPVGIGSRAFQSGCRSLNGPCVFENGKLSDKAPVLVAGEYGIVPSDVKNFPASRALAKIWPISGQDQISFGVERIGEPACFWAINTRRV